MAGLPYDGEPVDQLERTLIAQGGAMTEAELAGFRRNQDWEQAVQLRLIDDLGKVPGLEVPGIDSYRPELAAVVADTQTH
jgi:predicted HD phosphohydrolase